MGYIRKKGINLMISSFLLSSITSVFVCFDVEAADTVGKAKYVSIRSTETENEDGTGANAENSIAIGPKTVANSSPKGIAIGYAAKVLSTESNIAIGTESVARRTGAIALGHNTEANAKYTIAFGGESTAAAKFSTAYRL